MPNSVTLNGMVIEENEQEQLLAFPKPKKKEKKKYKYGPQYSSLSDDERREKRQEYFDRKKAEKARRLQKRKLHLDTHAPRWKKKAWAAFSRYIRIRDSITTTGTMEYCVCVTCNKKVPFKQIQAGHFIGGRNNKVLFDEVQVNGQCGICNVRLKGNWHNYYLVMVERHGQNVVNQMIQESSQTVLYNVSDYHDMVERYENRVNKLLEALHK